MEPKTKRQKVDVACDPCRSRKIKCDGQTPVCHPCQKRAASGIHCTWQTGLARTSHISSEQMPEPNVRPRASSFNSAWPSDTDPPEYLQTGTNRRYTNGGQPDLTPTQNDHLLQPPIIQDSLHLTRQNTQNTTDDLSTVSHQVSKATAYSDDVSPSNHSVHAIIGATVNGDSAEGFFGSSSAGTFMQNVQKIVQQRVGRLKSPNQSIPPRDQVFQTLPSSGHGSVKHTSTNYVLPARRRADSLLSIYWQYVHVLYPYIDRNQMEDEYEKLWKSDSSIADEQSFVCLLNVVFALTSQLDISTPAEERGKCAYEFYRRARALMDIVDTGSVRSVQSFLLLGQYFQSTSEPHPCWVFTGLAIRTAQSLGLNLDETSERATEFRAQQLLRRVWYGCVFMDRVTAMTYGRPCMIGPQAAMAVPYPIPTPEEQHVLRPLQDNLAYHSADVEFFVLSLKLYEILHNILYTFYSVDSIYKQLPNVETYVESAGQFHAQILEVDGRLASWQQSIPTHLKLSNRPRSGSMHSKLHRQACILHQRQLHVRTLLLRPVLSRFITSKYRNMDEIESICLHNLLAHKVVLQCAVVCVKVAIETVNTVHRESSSDPGEIGHLAAWWYNVLYLYTSATVLIAARLSSLIVAEIGEKHILSAWKKAMKLLEGYSTLSVTVKRLTTTLQLLSETVPQQFSGQKDSSRQDQQATSPEVHDVDNGTVPLPYWRPHDTIDLLSAEELPSFAQSNGKNGLSNEFSFDPMLGFDPNDLSWLMTIPLDHTN